MITHTQSFRVLVPPLLFKQVVVDVLRYQEFLPWCSQSRILSYKRDHFEGLLQVKFGVYTAEYISQVYQIQNGNSYTVISKSINNDTFKRLISKWDIDNLSENQCQVQYEVEFEFRNMIFQSMSHIFLKEVVKTMTKSFQDRAMSLHSAQINQEQKPENNKSVNSLSQNDAEQILTRLMSKQLLQREEVIRIKKSKLKTTIPHMLDLQTGDETRRDIMLSEYLKQLIIEQNL